MNAAASGLTPALHERDVTFFSIDSREVQAGHVFFALSQPDYSRNGFNGDFEDATRYVHSAFEKGAMAAVVRADRFEEHKADLVEFADRILIVEDAIVALQRLAHGVYLEWNKPVVAITGSAGKTTAKELTAQVLSSGGRKVLSNIKNYNNGLGHPLTVLNLARDGSYEAAVLEMGMSTPMHEIERLCRITPPDIAVVLNVLPVHVEHLGSIENVAAAKSEIVEGLKDDGTAVLNADDSLVLAMRSKAKGRIFTFGIENTDADIRAVEISSGGFGSTEFTLVAPSGNAPVRFPLNGKHNILNALAAVAVGHCFEMDVDVMAESLSAAKAPPQRGEIIRMAEGFTIINDSYNSNPAALLSMVETLVAGNSGSGRSIVIAGEMLELGETAAESHFAAGEKIAESGVDLLIGVRGLASELVAGAISKGLHDAVFAEDSDVAGELIAAEIRSGDVVLVKGSRGVRTEKVIEKLREKFNEEASAA